MLRTFFALAMLSVLMVFAGCGGTNYPYAEDFSKGISDPWTVKSDGVKVETTNGELHISGALAEGGWLRSGIISEEVFPESDFSASLDFRVPKFAGKGTPLVYLIAQSKGGSVGVLYYARFQEGYQLQDLGTGKMTDLFPALGDEKSKYHRLRLDYEYQTKKASAYVDDQLIASRTGSKMSGPIGFEICVSSDQPGMTVDAYFDNFSVVSPPPPISPSPAKKALPPPPPPITSDSETKNANGITEPEAAVLKMMLAVAKADRNAIEQSIVPHPEWPLLGMSGRAPDQVIQDLESRLAKGPSKLRRMEPGDRIFISKDKILAAEESDITADQIPLQEIEAPFSAFIVKRVNGVWKVDVSFLIESMKATLLEKSAAVQLDAPEEAVVNFMLAVMMGDKAAIENAILPNPESAILAEGQHAPETVHEVLKSQMRITPYLRLKPGDSFSIGNGKTHVVQDSEITADRLLISIKGAPLPFILVRSNGVWKVDAGPVIAGRKSAAAAAGKR
ncbi:MAG: hypothetical protein IT426_14435 [Pirellulales bacterium]|nr:hypothetical protein [Pirellulales bacterium]